MSESIKFFRGKTGARFKVSKKCVIFIILIRKSECNAMAGDSEQLVRKAKEIDDWLTELEEQLEKVGPLVIVDHFLP